LRRRQCGDPEAPAGAAGRLGGDWPATHGERGSGNVPATGGQLGDGDRHRRPAAVRREARGEGQVLVRGRGPAAARGVWAGPAARRLAAASATVPSVSGIRTANSSPPSRPTTSAWRTALRVASATSRSTASPVAWPCASFTLLKSSKSRYITASGRP